jgi:hypothetical protein
MPRFEATLERRGTGVIARIPDAVMDELGGRRVPVQATVNGFTWRTTTFVYGGRALIGFNKDVRGAGGVEAGDTPTIDLERDEEERAVEMPRPLAEALGSDEQARAAFDSMSYTHRKEYARWIDHAKREETRARRIERALELLREGRPAPS